MEAGRPERPLFYHLHGRLLLERIPPVDPPVWSALPRDPARAAQSQLLCRHQVLQDEGDVPVSHVPVQLPEVCERGQQVPREGGPEEETKTLPDVSHLFCQDFI